MIIIPRSDFTTMAWKNGGGVTHEIIKREAAGKMLWRFSVADVTSDGPFSHFEGLDRILTVIEGTGLMLVTPDDVLQALPFAPVSFSGSLPITSTRLGGHVQDFNLIFDPSAIAAHVSMERGILELEAQPENLFHAVLLTGEGVVQHHEHVDAGSFILLEDGNCRIESNAPMLHATCRTIATT